MAYKEDCPTCIGDGFFDLHCPYCDDNLPLNDYLKQLFNEDYSDLEGEVMKRLDPDDFELKVAGTIGILSKCPFCGRYPIITSTLNEDTGIYGALIICDAVHCGCTLHANSHSREESRKRAIEKWNRER